MGDAYGNGPARHDQMGMVWQVMTRPVSTSTDSAPTSVIIIIGLKTGSDVGNLIPIWQISGLNCSLNDILPCAGLVKERLRQLYGSAAKGQESTMSQQQQEQGRLHPRQCQEGTSFSRM